MKYKRIDPDHPRCPECNELFILDELKRKNKPDVCNHCDSLKRKLFQWVRNDEYNAKCQRYQ